MPEFGSEQAAARRSAVQRLEVGPDSWVWIRREITGGDIVEASAGSEANEAEQLIRIAALFLANEDGSRKFPSFEAARDELGGWPASVLSTIAIASNEATQAEIGDDLAGN